LLEEQQKLKVELATLKSPQRIEAIAREKLQMTYPEQGQVIRVNKPFMAARSGKNGEEIISVKT